MIVTALAVLGGVVLAFVLAAVISSVVRAAAHRSAVSSDLTRRSRRPLRVVLLVVGVWLAIALTSEPQPWTDIADHVLRIALIVSLAWLVGTLAFVIEDATLSRFRLDVPDNRHARRIRTQITVLRRLTVAILVVSGVAAVLLTFPAAQRFGGGIFASAGLLSIVAGLAAQSSLANLFAGLQLTFTDAIRADDVVVVDNEWGRIEEITLTYVVVHIWDDRRLILPSVYFTTTPFANWTRRAAELLGTVELDLDWAVPVGAMRAELTRLLGATDLWDHRVGVLQVTQATGGWVRVRALASAADAPTLFDLCCYVREGLVAWVQRSAPQALPRTRLETVPSAADARGSGTGSTHLGPAAPPVAARSGALLGTRDLPGDRDPSVTTGETTTTSAAHPVPGAPGPAPEAAGDGPEPDRVTRRSARVVLDGPQPGDTQRLDLDQQDARLFTGSFDAIERSKAFGGPGAAVIAEREQAAGASAPVPVVPSEPVTVVGPPLPAARPVDRPAAVPADSTAARPRSTAAPASDRPADRPAGRPASDAPASDAPAWDAPAGPATQALHAAPARPAGPDDTQVIGTPVPTEDDDADTHGRR